MMKLVRSSSRSNSTCSRYKLIGISFFSTKQTLTSIFSIKKTLTSPPPRPPLRRPSSPSLLKMIQSIRDPSASILPVLENWVDEGKTVNKEQLLSVIASMRKFNRYHHALEISRWMANQSSFDLNSGDVAVRLKLIYSVHGLEYMESYFNNLPKQFKVAQTYGTVLDCYVKEKSVDKAEAIMEEMKMMNLVTSSFPYNWLINLYAQTGQQEKIDIVLTEMKEKGIPQNKHTLTNRLTGYIASSDIEGIEKILKLMEDPSICIDWNEYSVAAKGYLKVGLIDKVLEMLKKIEEMTKNKRTNKASDYLLTLYASAGKKDDVYRIWNLYKSAEKVQNSSFARSASYSCMISSLDKLDEIEGAEKILKEWEYTCTNNDIRVLNQLVSVYCKRQLFEKAEVLVEKSVQKFAEGGSSPYASTWNILAIGYISDKQMMKGIEMLKKAILVGRQGWKPNLERVASCLEYFEVQRDVKGAEEFVKLLGPSGVLTKEVYHWLLRVYIAANEPVSDVLDRMKVDGFSADEETNRILQESPDS